MRDVREIHSVPANVDHHDHKHVERMANRQPEVPKVRILRHARRLSRVLVREPHDGQRRHVPEL